MAGLDTFFRIKSGAITCHNMKEKYSNIRFGFIDRNGGDYHKNTDSEKRGVL